MNEALTQNQQLFIIAGPWNTFNEEWRERERGKLTTRHHSTVQSSLSYQLHFTFVCVYKWTLKIDKKVRNCNTRSNVTFSSVWTRRLLLIKSTYFKYFFLPFSNFFFRTAACASNVYRAGLLLLHRTQNEIRRNEGSPKGYRKRCRRATSVGTEKIEVSFFKSIIKSLELYWFLFLFRKEKINVEKVFLF